MINMLMIITIISPSQCSENECWNKQCWNTQCWNKHYNVCLSRNQHSCKCCLTQTTMIKQHRQTCCPFRGPCEGPPRIANCRGLACQCWIQTTHSSQTVADLHFNVEEVVYQRWNTHTTIKPTSVEHNTVYINIRATYVRRFGGRAEETVGNTWQTVARYLAHCVHWKQNEQWAHNWCTYKTLCAHITKCAHWMLHEYISLSPSLSL